MVGRIVSHYRIVSQLGSGGMGVVYQAEDVRLGRPVALKFVADDMGGDEQALQRLRSEARAASALNHGNICTIYDVGEDEGRPFIVMELMRGENLRDRVSRGPLKVHQILDIGIEIADALHATHNDGIIHRDIKPGNIFLTESGHVKILDFGLAKLTPSFSRTESTGATRQATVAGITLGTISYMSPEQAAGEDLDHRTDIFSLGVVLYECATGSHPFPGRTSAVTLAGILNRAPAPVMSINPDIPVQLQETINHCLEKDRELRYQSAAELRADLKRVRRDLESGEKQPYESGGRLRSSMHLTGSSSMASRVGSSATMPPPAPSRRRAWMLGAAAASVATFAVIALMLWNGGSTPPQISATNSQTASPTRTTVENRLALATASFDARNYRSAAAYAAEVLAIDPNHAAAQKIRGESQAMLAKFDDAVQDARKRIAAGDLSGGARAVDAARALDPTAPVLIELTARLNELVRRVDANARAAADRAADRVPARAEPPPPPAKSTGTAKPASPTTPATPGSQTASPATGSQPPANPPETTAPAPVPVQPLAAEAPVVPKPLPTPPSAPEPRPAEPKADAKPAPSTAAPAGPTAEQDEAAIRRLAASYARAIETKDIGLFRSIKPNLSRAEERRLQDGFRAVTSQRVNLTVVSVDRRGDRGVMVIRRRDTIQAGGREQTVESQQTLTVARESGSWVIVDIK